jgi:hypothetical protein
MSEPCGISDADALRAYDRLKAVCKDRELLAAFVRNEAFKRARYRRMPTEVADDIAQEVALPVLNWVMEPGTQLRRKGQAEPIPVADTEARTACLKNYIWKCADRMVSARYGEAAPRPLAEFDPVDPGPTPPDALARDELLARARAELAAAMLHSKLPPLQKFTIWIHYIWSVDYCGIIELLRLVPESHAGLKVRAPSEESLATLVSEACGKLRKHKNLDAFWRLLEEEECRP